MASWTTRLADSNRLTSRASWAVQRPGIAAPATANSAVAASAQKVARDRGGRRSAKKMAIPSAPPSQAPRARATAR